MVVKQPQFTRVEEPTLLCNQALQLLQPARREIYGRDGVAKWLYPETRMKVVRK
jgi:hypothetical protein